MQFQSQPAIIISHDLNTVFVFPSVELDDGMLKDFLAETKGLVPYLRGEALHKADKLAEAHEEVAAEGQTQAPSRDDQV